MPKDNLTQQLDHLALSDAGAMPSAFSSRVTRRRWVRRATGAGAAMAAVGACFALVMVLSQPSPIPAPNPQPGPLVVISPEPTKFGETSLVVLSRAGLSARALQDTPGPRVTASFPPVVAEPPLRAFDVARVLRGL